MKLGRAIIVLVAMIVVITCIMLSTPIYFTLTKHSIVTITSAYVEPTLGVGDILVLQNEVSASDIVAENETGDILVYYRNTSGTIRVGRTVEKHHSGDIWTFKMRAQVQIILGYTLEEYSVNETNIIGRVVDINSISAYLYILLIPLGMVLVVLVVFLVILFYLKRISSSSSIGRS